MLQTNPILTSPVHATLPSQDAHVSSTVTVVQGLTMTVSSSNLVINDLAPGYGSDSNVIDIRIGSNTPYGYNLTASVGDNSTNNTPNLVGTNGSFSPLSNSAETLADFNDNEWGYSYKLLGGSNNWADYDSLGFHTNPSTIRETDSPAEETIQFKIAAKAGLDREAGSYSNVINFIATAKPKPPLYMQDVDTWRSKLANAGDELQAVDLRDGKIYWVTKLADGHIWMTQNLDYDIKRETPLTSLTSDINPELYGTTNYKAANGYSRDETTGVVSWTPLEGRDTINASTPEDYALVTTWSTDWASNTTNYNTPRSVDFGKVYQKKTYFENTDSDAKCNYVTMTNNNGTDICQYFSTEPDYSEGGNKEHGAVGNYYNWSAAVANNDTSGWNTGTNGNISANPQNSICPKGWRLPTVSTGTNGNVENSPNEFARLNYLYNGGDDTTNTNGLTNTGLGLASAPLWFPRAGYVYTSGLSNAGYSGGYWSSTVGSSNYAYYLGFRSDYVNPAINSYRYYGFSVRCVAR